MTVLNFNGYRINEMSYSRNPDFKKTTETAEITYNPEFKAQATIDEDDKHATILLEYTTPENFPFHIHVSMLGQFTYEKSEDTTDVGLERLVKVNGSAIIFPYIRALVSQLSTMGNEYTQFTLPTMNISAMFNQDRDGSPDSGVDVEQAEDKDAKK